MPQKESRNTERKKKIECNVSRCLVVQNESKKQLKNRKIEERKKCLTMFDAPRKKKVGKQNGKRR